MGDLAGGSRFPVLFGMTDDSGWSLGIGDPTFMGWLTVVAYFAAAFLSWKCARAARKKTPGYFSDEWFFWFCFALVLTLLGFNKQLDLQTLFTEIGKAVAKAQGWYEHRKVVQVAFIVLIALAGAASFLIFCRLSKRLVRREWLALGGGIFLMCFVLMRAASFHHFDQFIGMKFGGVKVNWILELGGICCVAASAFRRLKREGIPLWTVRPRRPRSVRV